MIDFNFNKQENELFCYLKGRMSADNATELSKSLEDKIIELKTISENPDRLMVNFDLKNVDFIASSFIRICVVTAKQLAEGNFRITNTIPMIKKTFKIAGLDEILNVS